MKAKLEALNEKAQALAVKLYEQAAAANKLKHKQEQKAHKQQEVQAMTS